MTIVRIIRCVSNFFMVSTSNFGFV